MTLPETPDISEPWCPTCQPERDPSREILRVQYCYIHRSDPIEDSTLPTTGAAGGESNKKWCDLIHRGKTC